MCHKYQIEKLTEQIIKKVSERTDDELEAMVALKIIIKGITAYTDNQDFIDKVVEQYNTKCEETGEGTLKESILECTFKKYAGQKKYKYSDNIKKMEVKVKNAKELEVIDGIAIDITKPPKMPFSIVQPKKKD